MIGPSFADDKPTFADLLTRAEAQAAAGHRWSPPGDNMTETIAAMMDLIPNATPKQLADLSALLESDASRLPPTAQENLAPDATAGATPSPSASATPSPSASVTPSPSASVTPSPSASVTPSSSASVKPSATASVTPSSTESVTPSSAESVTPPATQSVTSPGTAAVTPPSTASVTPPPTASLPPSSTPGLTPSSTVRPASIGRPVPLARAVPAETVVPPDRGAVDQGTAKPPAPAPVVVRPGPRAAELFARGQEAERVGDVSGARRFYAAATDQGSATAARSLGRLYDPGFLKQTALGGIDPDPALARHWYERAVAMGDAQAAPLLQALAAR